MTAITVEDLPFDLTLDREAMTAIHGSGAPWLYGWIVPFVESQPSAGPVVNLYETTNNIYVGQMINQFQNTTVQNTGANSNISVNPDERSTNRAA
jgi:hypothetical protein